MTRVSEESCLRGKATRVTHILSQETPFDLGIMTATNTSREKLNLTPMKLVRKRNSSGSYSFRKTLEQP